MSLYHQQHNTNMKKENVSFQPPVVIDEEVITELNDLKAEGFDVENICFEELKDLVINDLSIEL